MKKLLIIIVVGILTITSLHSQGLLPVQTHYSFHDSIIVVKTRLFNLTYPKKVRFNDFNAVLISESQMDSINLKYLKFKLLYGQNQSLTIQNKLFLEEIDKYKFKVDFLTTDNNRLSTLNTNNEKRLDNQDKIHKNEILYWQEKAKGKLRAFLFGTSIGALIVTILTLI